MFVTVMKGDILFVTKGIIVHGCNAQGKMGSGLASEIRNKYPGNYEYYLSVFESTGLHLNEVLFYKVPNSKLVIANAITQLYYGREYGKRYVNYDAIRLAFKEVTRYALENKLSVHFPKIGAGLAGGNWKLIKEIITGEMHEDVDYYFWLN